MRKENKKKVIEKIKYNLFILFLILNIIVLSLFVFNNVLGIMESISISSIICFLIMILFHLCNDWKKSFILILIF